MAMTYGSIDKPRYYLSVLWGEYPVRKEVVPKHGSTTYTFKTEAERKSFILGMSEACSTEGYDYIEHDKPQEFKLTDFDNYLEEE